MRYGPGTAFTRRAAAVAQKDRRSWVRPSRGKVVELSQRLLRVLAATQLNDFPIPEETLVYPNQYGGFLQGTNFRSRVFSKLVRETLGEGRHYSPHCLRHTWASLHMVRGTPVKWIQEQGGWTTAKLLLDTYGHFMPTEMRGFADALTATPNGPQTAPTPESQKPQPETGEFSWVSEATGPRSPIMHLTEPPPFLRNSETSTGIGVTPRSRT